MASKPPVSKRFLMSGVCMILINSSLSIFKIGLGVLAGANSPTQPPTRKLSKAAIPDSVTDGT